MVEAFIRELVADPTGEGIRRLAVVQDCLDAELTDETELRAFFDDLGRHWAADPGATWQTIWDRVCFPIAAAGESLPVPRFARRLAAAALAPVGQEFHHSIAAGHWLAYHYNSVVEAQTDAGGSALAATPPTLREAFRRAKETPGSWMQRPTGDRGAWLGQPAERNLNCWVSAYHLAPEASAWSAPSSGDRMLAMLGMPMPSRRGVAGWVVRYRIEPQRDPGVLAGCGTQPRFCDGGSRWFRVKCSDPEADNHRHAECGWGTALDMGTLAAGPREDAGLPERVCAPIPVDSPAIADMELLTPNHPFGITGKVEEETAHERLMDGRLGPDIAESLLQHISPQDR